MVIKLDNGCDCKDKDVQRHVHEFAGSTRIAERQIDPHNHRFAGMTGEAVKIHNGNHVHKIKTITDYYENHFHEICETTGPAIKVGDRHVHYLECKTSKDEDHCHKFLLATLVENPTGTCD